jgi:hypothetical protein
MSCCISSVSVRIALLTLFASLVYPRADQFGIRFCVCNRKSCTTPSPPSSSPYCGRRCMSALAVLVNRLCQAKPAHCAEFVQALSDACVLRASHCGWGSRGSCCPAFVGFLGDFHLPIRARSLNQFFCGESLAFYRLFRSSRRLCHFGNNGGVVGKT